MQADHTSVSRLIKTARGQLDGILKMIEEDRYCVDICHQLMATDAVLRRANREILRAHMEHCVREAADGGDIGPKMEELTALIDMLSR